MDFNDRNEVKIVIEYIDGNLIFKHNGGPFTTESLFGLALMMSKGKENNESVGRFGTGFNTTLILSREIEIIGDIICDDGNYEVFTITLYRDGDTKEELLKGFNKTKESYHFLNENDRNSIDSGWTIFKYKNANIKALEKGIENLKKNISYVMLFCPEINSVKCHYNGEKYSIERGETTFDSTNSNCKKLTLNEKINMNTKKRTILYNELIDRYEKIQRELKICCAIEFDSCNNIICDSDIPSIFCSFPLIGSEKYKLPFVINSPDFEPDGERKFLLLNETGKSDGKITNQQINKTILEASQTMYENIIKFICENGIKKRYLLASGLKSTPDISEKFDKEWYENSFMKPIRTKLLNYPIVCIGKEFKKLTDDVYIPSIKCYSKDEDQKKAYNFISILCGKDKVPELEESKLLKEYLWENEKNDNKIKYKTIEDCVKDIENFENYSTFKMSCNIDDKLMDDFLSFINRCHPTFLNNYSIIPNMNSNFIKKEDNLATSKNIPDNLIECLELLDFGWKETHIHKNITNFSVGSDHDIDDVITKIDK